MRPLVSARPRLPRMRGIDLWYIRRHRKGMFTRTCGDRRRRVTGACPGYVYPHAGSTLTLTTKPSLSRVYPACAGIDPSLTGQDCVDDRLPRMRGDRPYLISCVSSLFLFTPHARGSTPLVQRQRVRAPVYPACAGIDLCHNCQTISRNCLPRMRGDRPS